MSEQAKPRIDIKKGAKRVVAVVGALMAGVAMVGCSAEAKPAPTVTIIKTVEAPKPDSTVSPKTKLTEADCDVKFTGKDTEDCGTSFRAASYAEQGYGSLALSTVDKIDDAGVFTQVDGRDIVEPKLAKLAASYAKQGYGNLAKATVEQVDNAGNFVRSDAQKIVDAEK